jgi:hypothetical protein
MARKVGSGGERRQGGRASSYTKDRPTLTAALLGLQMMPISHSEISAHRPQFLEKPCQRNEPCSFNAYQLCGFGTLSHLNEFAIEVRAC